MAAAAISLRTLPSAAPYMTAFGVILGTALAARYGGWYIWFPFWILISFFDVFAGRDLHSRDPKTPDRDVFWHCALTWLWVPCLFALYIFVFYQIFVSGHLTWSETVGVSAALGQAVSISIAVGHDLAHRRRAWERGLSELLMSLAGLGYYTTEHVYIHHTHVATPYDPVTARKGETVYRFFARSWTGAIASSWRRDRERLARRGRAMWHFSNPWWRYVGVLCCWIALAAAVGGVAGVAVFLGAAALANLSLRGIDYGSIRESYALPRHGGGEAGAIIGAGGEADEVEPAQIVVQIAGGDPAARSQEVLPPAVAAVHRLHMQIAPNPFPNRPVEALVAHPERGGARRVARAAVGDQQGVPGEHRIEGGREGRRVNPGQHRAERRPAPVRCHENRHLLAREATLLRLAARRRALRPSLRAPFRLSST